ncbi:MAG: DUF5320 domain-containing protein [Draconibacterium sp.]
MPGLDMTGPLGQGSRTGRRQGRCRTETTDQAQTTESTLRRGFRMRFQRDDSDDFIGRGRGRHEHKHPGGRGLNRRGR